MLYLPNGSRADNLHLVLVPHLPVPGVDSGTVPHRRDVQGDSWQWECPDVVLCGPVCRWSRLRDRTSLLSRMTVRRPLDHLLQPSLMRDWLSERGLRP